jgi:hypothetical protein
MDYRERRQVVHEHPPDFHEDTWKKETHIVDSRERC